MKKVAEREEFDINADLSSAMSEIQTYATLLNKAERHMEAITKKSQNSGGNITFRQAYQGSQINNNISQSSQNMQQTLSRLVGDLTHVQKVDPKDSSTLRNLKATITSLESTVAQNVRRSGIVVAGQKANTPLVGYIQEKEQVGAITGVPTGVRRGATPEQAASFKDSRQSILGIQRDTQTDVNRIVNQANAAQRVANRSLNTGNISFETNQRFKTNAQLFTQQAQQKEHYIDNTVTGYKSIVHDNNQTILQAQQERESGKLSSEEVAKRTAHINQLSAQNKVLLETINSLGHNKKRLVQAQTVQEAANVDLAKGLDSGAVKQQLDPNSFLGRLNQYKTPVTLVTLQSTQNAFNNYASSGNNLRSAMYNSYGEAYTGQAKTRGFDQVNGRLIAVGTPYGESGSAMSELAGSYSTYAGTKGLVSSTRDLARWSRFGGLGNETTSQVATSAAELGVIKNDKDVRDLSKAFTGSLESTGLLAQARLQGKAYASVLNNLQGQHVNRKEAEDLGGILNGLGQQSPMLQGQNGANLINQFTQGSARSFNNPIVSAAFSANNPKFAGTKGRARLLEFMQNPFSDVKTLQKGLNTLSSYSGDPEVAAQQVANSFGISMPYAKEMLKAARNGRLTQWTRSHKKLGRDRQKVNQQNFEDSGVATTLKQESYQNQGENKASGLLDNVRGLTNRVKANPAANALASGTGSLIQGLMGGLVAGGTQLAFGRVLGRFGFTNALRTLGHLPARGLSALKGLFTGGKTVSTMSEAAKGATTASKFAKVTSKGAELASKGSEFLSRGFSGAKGIINRGGARLARKGSGLFAKAEPILTRIGAKATPEALGRVLGKVSPLVDAMAVTQTGVTSFRDMTSRKHRRQNRGMGALAGMASGAAVGLAVGGAPGALFGAGVGTLTSIMPGLNEKIGKGVRGVWNGLTAPLKPTKAKADTKTKSDAKGDRLHKGESIEQKANKWIKLNRQAIDAYGKVVDKISFLRTGESSSSDEDTDVGSVSGKGEKAIRSMAKKIGKKLGIDPKLIYAQLMFESGNGNSPVAQKDNNFGGITWNDSMAGQKGLSRGMARPAGEGGYYVHFDSPQSFANYYANMINSRYSNLKGVTSAREFAHRLKQSGYYTGSEADYAASLESISKKYAAGAVITQPTLSTYGESGKEARIPLQSSNEDNKASLQDVAGLLGTRVMPATQTTVNTNTKDTFKIKPKFNITLEHDDASVKQKILTFIQQNLAQQHNPMLDKLDYYSNEIVRN